jgi:condensin complex subunit 1
MNMIKILVVDRSSSTDWYGACEQTLTTIYTLCEYPEQYTELLLTELHKKLKSESNQSVIARFIFTLAHSSLKLLIHLDSLEAKLKKLKQEADKHNSNKNEEELDKVMGGIEGEFERRIERLQSLADAIPEDPFVAKWLRIIEYIVKNTESGSELERIAVLSFCKFMCISEKYCRDHMSTLFSTLSRPNMDAIIKNNIIISMGDLLHRFPNLVEPHSRFLYQNLHDQNPNVRKTTMIVLTHLILNDMIKVKGEMCNIAILFEDSSLELQNLAHIFFNEINKKEPKFIYNMLPEMITKLSSPD